MEVDDIFSQAETFEEPELEVSLFSTKTVAAAKGASGEDPW